MANTTVTLELVVRADTLPLISWMLGSSVISSSNSNYDISDTVEEEQGLDHYFKVRGRGRREGVVYH